MRLYFETIIFGFLIADGFLCWWLLLNVKKNWRYWIILPSLFAWGVIFYGSFIEPQIIVVRDQIISLSDFPEQQLHLAVISDLHVGPYKGAAFTQRVVEKISALHPDAVIILGDFIYKTEDKLPSLQPLSKLVDSFPVYAVMGNHDYDLYSPIAPVDNDLAEEVKNELKSLGITLLINEGRVINNNLWLAGVDDFWTKRNDVAASLTERPEDMTTLLLTHNPDVVSVLPPENNIKLVLAGHTHGGQIRLPFLGAIGRIPDELGQGYDQGLFEFEGLKLFLTSGLGESGPRARLFNPPEIINLSLRY